MTFNLYGKKLHVRLCSDHGRWLAVTRRSDRAQTVATSARKTMSGLFGGSVSGPTQESNAGHNGAFPPDGRTTVCVRSSSNCQTTSVCNTHTLDREGPAVHPQRLSHHRCEPGEHEHCQHLVRETMAELKHILDGAARTAGEQLERLAPFWAGASFRGNCDRNALIE